MSITKSSQRKAFLRKKTVTHAKEHHDIDNDILVNKEEQLSSIGSPTKIRASSRLTVDSIDTGARTEPPATDSSGLERVKIKKRKRPKLEAPLVTYALCCLRRVD